MKGVKGTNKAVPGEPQSFVSAGKALQGEEGIALIIVLWVLAFLMFLVIEFAYTMRVETSAVRNFKDETKARHLALAGINMAVAEISGTFDIVYLDGEGKVVFGKKEKQVMEALESKREREVEGGLISYRLRGEAGKLNINAATREMLISLLKATGVEPVERDMIADSILDWRDKNHEFHLNGAEDDYYGSLPEPYGAKDGDFDTVEELLLVRGVTPAIFYGSGKVPPEFGISVPGKAHENEDVFSPEYKGIEPYLTAKSNGKVNINTADKIVLDALLGEGLSIEVILRRETEGYFEWPLYGNAVKSDTFSIYSKGESGGIAVGIKVIAERLPDTAETVISYWREEGTGVN